MYWKIANAGSLPQRPVISELRIFVDEDCSVPILIPADGGWGSAAVQDCASGCSLCSGYFDDYGSFACTNAIDGDDSTEWKPDNDSASAGEDAWNGVQSSHQASPVFFWVWRPPAMLHSAVAAGYTCMRVGFSEAALASLR